MTTIHPAAAASGGAKSPAPGASALGAEAIGERFLKLLVAQMRNQDPLNPLDNAQITAQIAQISTVSGIERLNATLQTLAASFGAGQALQAAALIGREVLVPGSALELAAGGARAGFQLAEDADRVTLQVLDAAGRVVHTVELGAQAAGVHAFHWDGTNDAGAPLAPGRYSFSVAAARGGDKVQADALAAARVLGVTPGSAGTSLELSGLGSRPYGDVKQIL